MKKIFIISLLLCLFLFNPVFSQEIIQDGFQEEIITAQEEIVSASGFVEQDDLIKFQRDSIWQLAIISGGFLMICIMIILALVGIFYFFNIKPFVEEMISKTEKNLRDKFFELINEHKKMILGLEENTKKEMTDIKMRFLEDIKNMQISIEEHSKKLGEQIQTLEIVAKWDRHYVWQAKGIYINEVSSLISGLELIIKYKKIAWCSLFIGELNKGIGKLGKKKYLSHKSFYDRIVKIVDEIEGFEKEKEAIIKNAEYSFKES